MVTRADRALSGSPAAGTAYLRVRAFAVPCQAITRYRSEHCDGEVLLERVDENGMPVGHEQPAARTLATALSNMTFPFIRYDLGDQVTWLPEPMRVRQRLRARGRHRRAARRRLQLRDDGDSR